MERKLRLATGLILFCYAACHFLTHASGLFRLDSMDRVRTVLLAPWRSWVGLAMLSAAVLIHASLGLWALFRRRHLRIPPAEAWQLGLGLCIPLLLIPHATNVRVGEALYGLDASYYRILYQYWVTPPIIGLIRQLTLLFVVWGHGCVGLHFWLRSRVWYGRWWPVLLSGAVLLPFLAVLGLMNAGWDTQMTAALHPDFAAEHGPAPPGSARALAFASLGRLWWHLQLAWVALVVVVVVLRVVRNAGAKRVAAFRVTYPDGRAVTAPLGFSILEASRWARIPHAAICGGRGRCSTCRVRIVRGQESLRPPEAAEVETLRRVGAPPSVRLACQVRPGGDLSVVPLLAPDITAEGLRMATGEVRERHVTALSVDLRGSTRLAAGRLPFDTLFIIDRYVQRVTAAVHAYGGRVTSVAGDGVMGVFGAGWADMGSAEAPDETAAEAGMNALRAAVDVWDSMGALSEELRPELGHDLAFGMGLHCGLSTVGSIMVAGRPALQFLGDTGNVAARLEAATKDFGCVMIVSRDVLDVAGLPTPAGARRADILIQGRDDQAPCRAVLLDDRGVAKEMIAGRVRVSVTAPA